MYAIVDPVMRSTTEISFKVQYFITVLMITMADNRREELII